MTPGWNLNPRAEGALEAISYIKELVSRSRDREMLVSLLEKELDAPINDIVSGTVVDFRARLRLL